VQEIKCGFEGVVNTIDSVLKPAIDAVDEFFTAVFKPLFDHVKDVIGVFGSIKRVVDKIEHDIAPVKWALHAVSCIFEKIVNPILDAIMNVSDCIYGTLLLF